jgi:hypothetical protein
MAHMNTCKLALAVFAGGAVTALAPTSLAGAAKPGTERFDGVCELSGAIRHAPPLTMEPAARKAHGSFSGTCTGEFTDRDGNTRQLDGAPAEYEARVAGVLSCLGGTATGTGRLSFGRTEAIEFSATERRPAPGVAVVTLEGESGGMATVFGTVSPSEDLMEINQRCNGSGLRVVGGNARIVSLGLSG